MEKRYSVGKGRTFGAVVGGAWMMATVSMLRAEAPVFHPLDWPSPSERVTVFNDTGHGVWFEQQVPAVGDFDGDDCADLAFGIVNGAWNDSGSFPGEVRIILGAGSECVHDVGPGGYPPQLSIVGMAQADRFGQRVLLEDMNGDGLDDLIVSAPDGTDPDNPEAELAGAVYVFLGRNIGNQSKGSSGAERPRDDVPTSVRDADVVLRGGSAYLRLGWNLGGAGSLTDALGDELWVSVPGGQEPEVFLWFWNSAWDVGDVVYYALDDGEQTLSDPSTSQFFVSGPPGGSGKGFGWQMNSVSNGVDDVLILSDYTAYLAQGEQDDGLIWNVPVTPGNGAYVDLDSLQPENSGRVQAQGRYGWSMTQMVNEASPSQDVAFWVGAPREDVMVGERLARGRLLRTDRDDVSYVVLPGQPTVGDGLGTSVTTLPDMEGEAPPVSELVVGYQGQCGDAEDIPGRVYLVWSSSLEQDAATGQKAGTVTELPYAAVWEGKSKGDCFGASVAGGDFNGDDETDLAVVALNGNGTGQLVVLWSVSRLWDEDGDGISDYPGLAAPDCDDLDGVVYPDANESCDDLDNDCDGQIDEGETLAFYQDLDGDGYGVTIEEGGVEKDACVAPEGFSSEAGDCNDQDDRKYPGSTIMVCDGEADDCSGAGPPLEEEDADHDGVRACEGDCDDQNMYVSPQQQEVCNGVDDDCDGILLPDEEDADHDGFIKCKNVPHGGDCNDQDNTVNPDAQVVIGDDYPDANCDGDEFVNIGFQDERSPEKASGCLAIQTNRSYVFFGFPALLLWLRRRQEMPQKSLRRRTSLT